MKCLVTGATGLIGAAVTKRLLADGLRVNALVRTEHAAATLAAQGATPFVGSLGDPNTIAEAARGCEAMVHAAGSACVRSSARALGWVHVAGTENALTAAEYAGCRLFVHLSCTDATLVRAGRPFWDESVTPTEAPLGALAQSKLAAEEIVQVSGNAMLRTVVLRPAMVWGPGDRTRLPRWCAWALDGRLRLVGGGGHMMATTFVDNVAHGVALSLVHEVPSGRVFHILDAETPLARDFFREVCSAAGVAGPKQGHSRGLELALARARRWVGAEGMLPVEVVQWGASTSFNGSRARVELGYAPVVDRATGMARLAEWIGAEGGTEAVARQMRAPLSDADIVEQVALADAIGARSL